MRNEDRCVIRLTRSTTENDVIFYHFEIQHRLKLYQLSCRYSKLRTISQMLPKTQVKFPQPCHLTMAISNLIGNKTLVEQRYEKLNKYFDEISKLPFLSENKGFKRLLEESELVGCIDEKQQNCLPKAPRTCGKRICSKQLSEELLIVVG